MLKRFLCIIIVVFSLAVTVRAQENKQILYLDSTETWNLHFQYTNIWQMHPAFHSLYSGKNSLSSSKEDALSLTGTLFFGVRLWKGAAFYYNPEIAGGRGLSSALGIAG